MSKKTELEPPDMKQCQAEIVTTRHTPFVMGGPTKSRTRERCTNEPAFLIRERTPDPKDGLMGSMGVCLDCMKIFHENVPKERNIFDDYSIEPITERDSE